MGEDLGHLFNLLFVECYMSARVLSDHVHMGVTNKQKVFIADFLEELRGFWRNAGGGCLVN